MRYVKIKSFSTQLEKIAYAFYVSFSAIISILFACYFDFISNTSLSLFQGGLILFSSFLTMLTTRGTPIRQGIMIMLTLMFSAAVSFFLTQWNHWLAVSVIILLFLLGSQSAYLISTRRLPPNHPLWLVLLATLSIMMMFLFPSNHMDALANQLIEILLGASIGISMNWIYCSVKIEHKFGKELLELFNGLIRYSDKLENGLLIHHVEVSSEFQDFEIVSNENIHSLSECKIEIETILLTRNRYPEWSFETGFNPGLRSGFRFFLLHIERIVEIFFALEYLLYQTISPSMSNEFSNALSQVMKTNKQLLEILCTYFANHSFTPIPDDLYADVSELEKALNDIVPQQIELLDIAPQYILLTDLVRKVKDIRELLVQLLMSLPTQ